MGCGREEPRDESFLMLPCLTDLQGMDNPTDILFWNLQGGKQRKKKVCEPSYLFPTHIVPTCPQGALTNAWSNLKVLM